MTAPDSYHGLLLIGDPHLDGRTPGFRKDDYPNTILEKLAWCLDYAEKHQLLPAILGDLFDKPRDNPNWLLVRLLSMFDREVIGLYGNHDVHYHPALTDDDSLSVLVKSGRLRLVSSEQLWCGTMRGRRVVIGGSSYRQELPAQFAVPHSETPPLVVWLAHHNILMPGCDEAEMGVRAITPHEIEGIDFVVNGHIHRRLEEVRTGMTGWLTPGNITRIKRSDATRLHVPAVLRIDVSNEECRTQYVGVPHLPFDDVFHEILVDEAPEMLASAFVTGLAELQARRTADGAGLMEFLKQNVNQFEPDVSEEIMNLAQEVMSHGSN